MLIIIFFSLLYIVISVLWFYTNVSIFKNLNYFNRKEQKILRDILKEYFKSTDTHLRIHNICVIDNKMSEKEIETFRKKLKHFSLIEEDIPESCDFVINPKNLINLYI